MVNIGGVTASSGIAFSKIQKLAEKSPVRCADPKAEKQMIKKIDQIKATKDTVGGVFEIQAKGLPPGLGSFTTRLTRMEARLSAAVMSIQAVKGVEFGLGFEVANTPGSQAHDEIFYQKGKFVRKTNRSGGLEGGMTTGDVLILRASTKPYSTLMKPLSSVNIKTKKKEVATIERSDVTAVPACGVVAEAMVAFELANVMLEKFGGDSFKEAYRNYQQYLKQLKDF